MRGKSRYKRYGRLFAVLCIGFGLSSSSVDVASATEDVGRCTCQATIRSSVCDADATQVFPIPTRVDGIEVIKSALSSGGIGCSIAAEVVDALVSSGQSTLIDVTAETCEAANFAQVVDIPVIGSADISVSCSLGGGTARGGGRGSAGSSGSTSDLFDNSLKQEINSLNRTGVSSPADLIGKLIGAALGVIGAVTLLMLVYGGVMWMTAAGNSERSGKAIRTIAWAGVGAVVVLSSFTIVQFIFGIF